MNTADIIHFIQVNSEKSWNDCCSIFSQELDKLLYEFPDQVEMEDEERISKVIVEKLKEEGWIKKFTETQEIKEDYFILFTD